MPISLFKLPFVPKKVKKEHGSIIICGIIFYCIAATSDGEREFTGISARSSESVQDLGRGEGSDTKMVSRQERQECSTVCLQMMEEEWGGTEGGGCKWI